MPKCGLSVDFSGLLRDLERAGRAALPAAKVGLYDCAGMVADAIREEADALPFKGSTVQQIKDSIGIATFRDGLAETDTSVTTDGYFAESGFPIPFFVREVEKGTSQISANPFMRRAFLRVRAAAEAKGEKAAEEFAQKIIDNISDT